MEQQETSDTSIPELTKNNTIDYEGFTGTQQFIIWVFCLINHIITGGVLYYLLKNTHPEKAKQANKISITVFLIALAAGTLIAVLKYVGIVSLQLQ